jgi:hypothetical protein
MKQVAKYEKLAKLPEDARPGLAALLDRLTADLGENMRGLLVVGSVLTADYRPGRSDINTVLIVGRRSHELLRQLASYGNQLGRYRLRAPLVMTEEYILRSLDVFPIEFLDFQLNHLALVGADPLAGAEIRPEDVRLQCERELKAALMALRQGYISAAGQNKAVGELLMAALQQILPTIRAMLLLENQQRHSDARRTIEQAAEHLAIDPQAMLELWDIRRQGSRISANRVDPLFQSLYQAIDQLSRRVDRHGEEG